MNIYNVLDKLKAIAEKDPHYRDAANNTQAYGFKTVSEGVHGETCNECGMYESHCECPEGEVMEGDKPDFLDLDKDGNKKESMKKAAADKKEVKESPELRSILKHAGIAMITPSGTMAAQADSLVESINKTKSILNENYSGGLNLTPVAEKRDTETTVYRKKQGAAKGSLNELAPGGSEGNGPFDYGPAIIQIGKDFSEFYDDEGADADARAIIKVGNTFMSAGMEAGIQAFYAMDTQVRDHVAEQLMDQGFNVRQDIYQPYDQQFTAAEAANGIKTILALLKEFSKTVEEPEDRKTVAGIYKAFQQGMKPGFVALRNAFEFDIDADFYDFARDRGIDLDQVAARAGFDTDSLHEGKQGMAEKWDTETKVAPSEKGKYAGKTTEELRKSLAALKKSGPHEKGSKEYGRMKELQFAIRAKTGWGKVDEAGMVTDPQSNDEMGAYDPPLGEANVNVPDTGDDGRNRAGVTLGEEEKTHKGGTVTKTATGIKHKAKEIDWENDKDEEESDEPRGRGRPKKKESEKTSASLPWGGKPPKASQYKLPKHKGTTWGMKGGEKFSRAVNEGIAAANMMIVESYPTWKREMRAAYPGVSFQGNVSKCRALVEGVEVAAFAAPMAEKAPPGAKYERMVKHIKQGYAKDGKLTPQEKSIAYATAWKKKNSEMDEGVWDTIKSAMSGSNPMPSSVTYGSTAYPKESATGMKDAVKKAKFMARGEEEGMLARAGQALKSLASDKPKDFSQEQEQSRAHAVKRAAQSVSDLDEVSKGEYLKQQDAAAEKSGKDSFKAFGQDFSTKEIDETIAVLERMKALAGMPVKEESDAEKDDKAEKAAKKVAKDVEYDDKRDHDDTDAEKRDDDAEEDGEEVKKDIEYDDKKDSEEKDEDKDKDDKDEKVDESEESKSGGYYGKGVYEAYESQFQQMVAEDINVSTNQSSTGDDTVTVTATQDDAQSLVELLKMAGMGREMYQKYDPGTCAEEAVTEENSGNTADATEYGDVDELVNRLSGGLNGMKLQYAKGYKGDNDITTIKGQAG